MWKTFLVFCLMFLAGCGNLSPSNRGGKLLQRIKNNSGDIRTQNENVQGIKNDITLSKNESKNSGTQILQGDGALVLILSLVVIICGSSIIIILLHERAQKSEKALKLLAKEVINKNDPDLENNIFLSSVNSGVEKELLNVIKEGK